MASIIYDPTSRLFAVLLWAATAALWDYRFRRLPNYLTLGGSGLAVGHLIVYGSSVLGASPHSAFTAGIGALIVLLPIYRLGWLGGGDVKLMSAIGFVGGFNALLTTFVISSLLSLPAALLLFLRQRRNVEPLQTRALRLPQGTFLGLGLILIVASGITTG